MKEAMVVNPQGQVVKANFARVKKVVEGQCEVVTMKM